MTSVIQCANLGKAFPMGKRQPAEVLKHELLGGGTKYAQTFWALRHCDLTVREGEAVGIIGQNGSGKSTLLQMIAGVYPPSEGSLQVHGKIAALLELGSGFDPEYTGRQNVFMSGAVLGLSKQEIEARFDDIAAFADIGDFINQQVRTYSSGMFVRLAFSVAIHADARILIVDEALAVGDARFAAKCMRRISKLREDGVTLLFVSHDVSAVRALCDHAMWLHGGMTREFGDVPDVTARYSEYLFADETSDGETPAQAASGGPGDTGSLVGQVHPAEGPSTEEAVHAEKDAEKLLRSGILNHWGTRLGCVTGFRIEGAKGLDRVFEYGEDLHVSVELDIPDGIDNAGLSVAFAIKDLRGADLLVCATALEDPGLFVGQSGRTIVKFRFKNLLTEGKYYFAVAVEDRSEPAIHYFEYIEGVEYFASLSSAARFGVFNVPVSVELGE